MPEEESNDISEYVFLSSPLSYARVDQRIDEIHDEVDENDHRGGKENQSLYDHVIFIYDTIGYFQTYARIIENAFHERRAAEQRPERYAKLRNERQKSVLFHVFAAYQSFAQSPRAGREDIILSEHADTASAHVQNPVARLHDRIRQNGQEGVIQHVQNKGKIKPRRHFESVVIVLCGEPFELIGKYDDENERDEIIGHGPRNGDIAGRDFVGHALALLRDKSAHCNPDKETDEQRYRGNEQRPGQPRRNQAVRGDARFEVRISEFSAEQTAHVPNESLKDIFVRVVVEESRRKFIGPVEGNALLILEFEGI